MKFREIAAAAVVVIACLFLIGSCVRWRFGECRSVGHGVAYCVMESAR